MYGQRATAAVRVAVAGVSLALACGSAALAQSASGAAGFWPEWRGPLGTGVAPHGDPPVSWNESTNVRWKVEIPGLGSATPVIWGDRLFLLTAVPVGQEVGVVRRSLHPFSPGGSWKHRRLADCSGSWSWRSTAGTAG